MADTKNVGSPPVGGQEKERGSRRLLRRRSCPRPTDPDEIVAITVKTPWSLDGWRGSSIASDIFVLRFKARGKDDPHWKMFEARFIAKSIEHAKRLVKGVMDRKRHELGREARIGEYRLYQEHTSLIQV